MKHKDEIIIDLLMIVPCMREPSGLSKFNETEERLNGNYMGFLFHMIQRDVKLQLGIKLIVQPQDRR